MRFEMTKIVLAAGTILLLATSCLERSIPGEEEVNEGKAVYVLTCSSPADIVTKTQYINGDATSGALNIAWCVDEYINVWYNGTAAETVFHSTNTEVVESASFVGVVTMVSGSGTGPDGKDYFYGYYPYSKDNSISNGIVSTTLPAEQPAVHGNNIANNLLPWAARSEALSLHFRNVGCSFRFKPNRDDIRYVELFGNNNEILAGPYKMGFDANGLPEVTDKSEGAKTVRLTAPNGGTFNADTWYYLVLFPTDFTKGYTLKAYTDTQVGTFSTTASRSFPRAGYFSYTSMATSMTWKTLPAETAGGENRSNWKND